jgi:cardiolipin synthase
MTWHDTMFWAWVFVLGEWTIRVIMLATVPFRRTPAAAKGWLLLIFFEPWIGLVLYLLIGRPTLPRRRIERISRLPQVMSRVLDRLANHPNVSRPRLAPELSQAVLLAENLGQMPVLGGNAAEILVDYDAVLDRLVADIDGAEHHVHLLFYIFADDRATAPVIAALGRASGRGVRCRVLVDSVGSRSAVSTLVPKLTASGVAVRETLPIGLFRWRSARLDLRNHRKIAVIDGRVAYTGSQNLVAADFKEGITYEELMLRVTGPAVWDRTFPPRTTSGSSWP